MSAFQSQSSGSGEQLEATVKWFNGNKGFGFVAPVDGSPDAFLHMSSLARHGLQQINEGAKLLVELGHGPKGRQVLQIIKIISGGESSGGSYAGSSAGSVRRFAPPSGQAEDMIGTIKWFKPEKGFGFAAPDDGGKDVFVHKSLVTEIGLQSLNPGQRIRMAVHTAAKGREASSIQLID